MELKWFEDLVSVAEKGHFARAAEARHITQSALSRRIKSLEIWVGADLLDRSAHPIELTAAGREFMPVAKEIIALAQAGKGRAAEYTRLSERTLVISCLHTLALYFVPQRIAELQAQIGPFETSIVAETRTIDEYLSSLQDGSTDMFIGYGHPSAPLNIDFALFPKVSLGTETIALYANPDHFRLEDLIEGEARIPFLDYSGTSFISRVVGDLLIKTPFRKRLRTVYRASLAESLCTGAQRGLGIAWLPESIARDTQQRGQLVRLSDQWSTDFDIMAIRASSNTRPIVSQLWSRLGELPPRGEGSAPDIGPG